MSEKVFLSLDEIIQKNKQEKRAPQPSAKKQAGKKVQQRQNGTPLTVKARGKQQPAATGFKATSAQQRQKLARQDQFNKNRGISSTAAASQQQPGSQGKKGSAWSRLSTTKKGTPFGGLVGSAGAKTPLMPVAAQPKPQDIVISFVNKPAPAPAPAIIKPTSAKAKALLLQKKQAPPPFSRRTPVGGKQQQRMDVDMEQMDAPSFGGRTYTSASAVVAPRRTPAVDEYYDYDRPANNHAAPGFTAAERHYSFDGPAFHGKRGSGGLVSERIARQMVQPARQYVAMPASSSASGLLQPWEAAGRRMETTGRPRKHW